MTPSISLAFFVLATATVAAADYSPAANVADASIDAWQDARPYLRGTGFPAAAKGAFYDRLPAAAEGAVRGAVWALSRDSAGMYAPPTSPPPPPLPMRALVPASGASRPASGAGSSGCCGYLPVMALGAKAWLTTDCC